MQRAVSVLKRWARFGPDNPSKLTHIPKGGVCISAFVVVKRGNLILLGLPRVHDAWPRKGGYAKWRLVEPEMRSAWLLPATHLQIGEHPDHAARRISHEWAGLKGKPRFMMIQSHLRRRGRRNHWDLCIVYELRVRRLPKCKPWWSKMQFADSAQIRRMKLGRGHKDVLKEGGYV